MLSVLIRIYRTKNNIFVVKYICSNNSMRNGHTDVPKTNNSFSACFAPRRDQVEDYENVPLGTISVRKNFQTEDILTQGM